MNLMVNTFKIVAENLKNIRIAQINCIIAKTLAERNEIHYSKNEIQQILEKIQSSNIRIMQLEKSNELKQLSEQFFM